MHGYSVNSSVRLLSTVSLYVESHMLVLGDGDGKRMGGGGGGIMWWGRGLRGGYGKGTLKNGCAQGVG